MAEDRQRSFSSEAWCGIRGADLRHFIHFLRQQREQNGHSQIVLREEVRNAFKKFLRRYPLNERSVLRRTLGRRIAKAEEAILCGPRTCLVLREEPGLRRAYLIHHNGNSGRRADGMVELLDKRQFLSLRESIVLKQPVPEDFMFGIDFSPFRVLAMESGSLEDIGEGPGRVGAHLAEQIRAEPQATITRVLDFLGRRSVNGAPILFTEQPRTVTLLLKRLTQALDFLSGRPAREEIDRVAAELELLGFAAGWGLRVGRVRENLELMRRLIRDPDSQVVQRIFQRLPLLRRVVLVSVHGWFAQANVLGRPDTGGQLVYLFDQARALEKYLKRLWRQAGVPVKPEIIILARQIPEADGTTCNRRKERIRGTENGFILRLPFRNARGEVLRHWISRFQVWPYLQRFAQEAFAEIKAEFGGTAPDLVVGNYSDGNMVAAVMGREWNVPVAVVAHALEKNKYLLSDLYWKDLEAEYYFSIHFLSDILASNAADFIQVSSYQEIAGTVTELGQYESYELFTLPGLYRVFSGINIHSARFVINPPGTDVNVYHPYSTERRGDREREAEIEQLAFRNSADGDDIKGRLADPSKPFLFTMARLDKIKNLTGLVKAYGRRPALRRAANLLIVSGVTELHQSEDHEEQEQIRLMAHLFNQYDLWDNVCWIPAKRGQGKFPHFYRFTARRGGIFVQPAIFEAFGLTVLEAMACGLPVIATRFGGPASVIEDNVSGILYDPNRAQELERAVLRLLNEKNDTGESFWESVSRAGLRRVHEHFSWEGHARRLTSSWGLYSLLNHLFPDRRRVRRTYVDALHHFLFRPLVQRAWPEEIGGS